MIQRQRDLRSQGIIEVSPGNFIRIGPPTNVGASMATAAPQGATQADPATGPVYNPPALPAYAPGFIPSPVRPGFEGMPAVPDYGSKFIL